jgi:hypothetical protein
MDAETFAGLGGELALAAEAVVADWIVGCVTARHPGPLPPNLIATAREAGAAAAAEVGCELRALAAVDADEQTTTPLAILRRASRHATAVLAGAGVAHVPRDPVDAANLPDDVYAVAPAHFADVDGSLVGPGISWGAAKAHIHLRRHDGSGGT